MQTKNKHKEIENFLELYSKWKFKEFTEQKDTMPFDGSQCGGIIFSKSKRGRRYIEFTKRCYID